MSAQELLPGRLPAALRRRLHPMPLQNVSDRAAGNVVSQIGPCDLDAPIAPIPVLFRHAKHPSLDLSGRARSPRSALATAVVVLRDQFPMPSQQGLGRDNGGDLSKILRPIPLALAANRRRWSSLNR